MYLLNNFQQNATLGTNITQIKATDSDFGPEGQLEIGFVPNEALAEDHSFFNIDPDSGIITIKNELDRELKQSYQVRQVYLCVCMYV